MFQAAIFDVDGLLIDSERAIMRLWLRATANLARPMTESDYIPTIGRAAKESAAILIERLGPDVFERTDAEVQTAIQTSNPEQLFPPKPGARDILEHLRGRGVRCVVASSTVSSEVRRRLEGVHLLEFFEAVIGGDRVPLGKPDPALYRLAAATLGVAPASCLAFEDSDHGVSAATAAAVSVVLIPDLKAPSPAALQNSLMTLTSLTEAIQHINHWFKGPG
ncbi:MAG TPA: HAD family phosphatase [Steroidobacteraceae bacterium]